MDISNYQNKQNKVMGLPIPPITQKIFLSYARIDANIAHEVYTLIKNTPELDVWYDKEDIVPSEDWDYQINAGLIMCDSLLLIASRYSISSEKVKQELDFFLTKDKQKIYIALIDNTPIDPDIAGCPLIDFRADPLNTARWNEFIGAIHDHSLVRLDQDLHKPVYPAYVKVFLS